MRRFPLTATAAAVLLGALGWAGPAGAQVTTVPSTPAPQAAAPTPIAPPQAGPPPSAPGSVVVRVNGRMTAGVGAASDSGRPH